MDLSQRLRRWMLGRPRVLLVDAPGSRHLRWQVEATLDRRGWPLALSPADTDLLVVLGRPGPELTAAIDLLWSQTPLPRHRHQIHPDADVATELDRAHAMLLDKGQDPDGPQATPTERLTSRTPTSTDEGSDAAAGHDMSQMDQDMPGMGHDTGDDMASMGHDMSQMDQDMPGMGHDMAGIGHDMAGMGHDMAGMGHDMHHDLGDVAGLPMAGTAADRDGLELDSLRVSLGPVLPGWPTGLVVRGALQGDVLTEVSISRLDEPHAPTTTRPRTAAPAETDASAASDVLALDYLSRFLLVAGWPGAADAARSARTDLLSQQAVQVANGRRQAARLARRVRGSRTLRWSVRGLGGPSPQDVLSQMYRWCDLASGALEAHYADPDRADAAPSAPVEAGVDVAGLLEGAELAAVRLIVAGLELDLLSAAAAATVHRGAGQ